MAKIGVGDVAPDFELDGAGAKTYKLSDYAGKPVVLVFYPGDGTTVCTLQLRAYDKELENFGKLGAQVIGISPQDVESKEKFCNAEGFGFPLLADTTKTVAEAYGVLGPLKFLRRSVFVIDREGKIGWLHRSLAGATYTSTNDITAALNALPA